MGIDDCGNPSIFHFLLYGDYGMNITNSTKNTLTGNANFLPYNENITSAIYGIYNTANPQSKYKNAGSEYAYPVVLQRNDTYVRGTIAAERKEQPLHGTYDGILKPSKNNLPSEENGETKISSYVLLENINNTSEQYTCALKDDDVKTLPNGNYIYDFDVCIKNRHEGEEFNLYLVSNYGGSDGKMTIKKWPATITADGCIYELETAEEDYVQVDLETDVKTFDFTIECIEAGSNPKKPVAYTATIERCGLESWKYSANVTADKSGTTHNQGIANFKNVKKGFYTLTIDYLDSAYDYPNEIYTIFVGEGNYLIEASPTPEHHSFVFECTPVTAGGIEITEEMAPNVIKDHQYFQDITFDVYFDDIPVESKDYTVYKLQDSNRLRIEMNYYAAANSVRVEQSVQCFEPNDKFTYTGTLPDGMHRFQIHRLEVEDNDNDHPSWTWQSENGQHTQYCDRCAFGRYTANHYVDGSGQGKTTTTYFTTVYSSDDTNTRNTHIKHCAICNLYDKNESCSSGGWTSTYDSYIASTSHSSVHSDASDSYKATTPNTSTTRSSSSRHYRYCNTCGGRTDQEAHGWSTGCSHTSAYSGTYFYKCISDTQHQKKCGTCSYSETASAHNTNTQVVKYYDADGNVLTSETNAHKKVTYYYCSDCGHAGEPFEEILHTHKFDKWCGVKHEKSGQLVTECYGAGGNKNAHCWHEGCGATTCTHTTHHYGCITCSCGISELTANYSPLERWCGAHYGFSDTNKAWKDTINGLTNQHY